jgi:DnaJ-class molecular chaperone
MFAERYLASLNTTDLRDDEQHRRTEALAAAALADLSGGSGNIFGSMLARAKVNAIAREEFGSGVEGLPALLRAWEGAVIRKGVDRKWIKIVHTWDIGILEGICKKIARVSLAHWLDGACEVCNGTTVSSGRSCSHCDGTGREPVQGGALEIDRVKDMISDLEGIYQAHGGRAGAKMRQAA